MKFKLTALAAVVLGSYGMNATAGTCTTDAWDDTSAEGGMTLSAEARAGYEGDCVLVVNKPLSEPFSNGAFVRYNFASGEPRVRGRFIIDPSGMDFDTGSAQGGDHRGRVMDIRKPDAQPSPRLLLQAIVRQDANNGDQYQINFRWVGDQIGATPQDRARGRCTNPWVDIPAGPSSIEFDYQFESTVGAGDGQCTVWVDGVQVDTTTNISNGALDTGSLRFGLIRGFAPNYEGEVVLDAVEMRRSTSPGCVSGVGACP